MAAVLVTVILGLASGAAAGAIAARQPWRARSGPHLAVATLKRFVRNHPRTAEFIDRRVDPGVVTGAALTVTLAGVAVAAAAVGVLVAMVRSEAGLSRSDPPIAEWAAAQAAPLSADVLRLISRLGGTEAVVLVALAVAGLELRRMGDRAVIALLAVTVGGQFALTNTIKAIVDRARPELEQLTGHAGTSFPSGHAAAAAATFACVALLLSRRRSRAWVAALWGLAVGIAVAVAATRVMLGVHWTTDVVGGLIVGWAWFALCSAAFGGRLVHFGAPAEIAQASAERVVHR